MLCSNSLLKVIFRKNKKGVLKCDNEFNNRSKNDRVADMKMIGYAREIIES